MKKVWKLITIPNNIFDRPLEYYNNTSSSLREIWVAAAQGSGPTTTALRYKEMFSSRGKRKTPAPHLLSAGCWRGRSYRVFVKRTNRLVFAWCVRDALESTFSVAYLLIGVKNKGLFWLRIWTRISQILYRKAGALTRSRRKTIRACSLLLIIKDLISSIIPWCCWLHECTRSLLLYRQSQSSQGALFL